METRNATPPRTGPVQTASAQVGPGSGGPSLATRAAPPALHTPLVWAWGGALLTATLWLTGIIAFFRSIGSLFD